jgi:hypothetical protein
MPATAPRAALFGIGSEDALDVMVPEMPFATAVETPGSPV